jgi:putative transposase
MARPLRIHIPGAFYHVTLRGNHRQQIFFRPEDRDLLNDIVAEAIDRLHARVHAYCWMSNHVHLLVQVGDTPLGRIMLRIGSRYARAVQRRLETTGHLFERRHHPTLVDADEYLLAVLRYIHRNPVDARIVPSAAEYPWSSHHAYIGARAEPWVTTDFALRMFHPTRARAVAAYLRFLQEPLCEQSSSLFEQLNPNDPRVLGSDDFIARMQNRSGESAQRATLEEIIQEACLEFSVSEEALQSPSRRRCLTRVRAWIVRQAIHRHAATISAVARRLNRDESTIRYLLEHGQRPT